MSAESFRVELLGCFRIVGGSDPPSSGSSAHRLLALLALRRRPMPREQVAAMLWPDVVDTHAQGRLRTALWRLGSTRPQLVHSDGDHLELAETCDVDLHDAETLGRLLLSGGSTPVDGEAVIETFSLDLLPDWDEPWVNPERECYRETRVHVLEALAARFLERNSHLLAIKASLAAIACSPFRDTSHRLLVRAYREEGNTLAGLRHLLSYREDVREQLCLPADRVLPDLFQELVS